MKPISERAARRAAKMVGLIACKSRQRTIDSDNYGHFMLLDIHNRIVGGEASRRFNMSTESVYLWCWEWAETGKEPPPPIPSVIWLPSH
jgi:hypothetical protein